MEGRVHQHFVAFSLIFLLACQSEDDVKDLTVSFSTCESCFVCSGMKLQKDVILTAAHCFDKKEVKKYRSWKHAKLGCSTNFSKYFLKY